MKTNLIHVLKIVKTKHEQAPDRLELKLYLFADITYGTKLAPNLSTVTENQ